MTGRRSTTRDEKVDPLADLDSIDLAPVSRRGAGPLSGWIVPLTWLGLCAVALVVGTNLKFEDTGTTISNELNALTVVELGIFGLVAAIVAVSPLKNVRSRPLALLWVYTILLIFTTVYSTRPDLTLVAGLQLLVLVFLAHGMAVRGPGRHHMVFFAGFVAVSTLLVMSAALGSNHPSATNRLSTTIPILKSNDLATYLGLGLLVMVYAAWRHPWVNTGWRRPVLYALMAAHALALVATQSRMPIAAAAIALVLMWVVNGGSLKTLKAQLTVLGGFVLVTMFGYLILEFFSRGEPESLPELTGRVGLWEALWPVAAESPIVGHGYLSGRELIPELEPDIGWATDVAHNAFLETVLNGGIATLAVFVALLIFLVLRLIQVLRSSARGEPAFLDASLYLSVIVFSLVVALTESQLAQNVNHAAIWLAMAVAWVGGYARLVPESPMFNWRQWNLLAPRERTTKPSR